MERQGPPLVSFQSKVRGCIPRFQGHHILPLAVANFL
jgi:hypothetical protein